MPSLILLKKQPITTDISVFHLGPQPGRSLASHSAGAHIDFDLGGPGVRSYSLIDWPASDGWVIAVKREDDGQGGSKAMHGLEVGQSLTSTDPINDFELRDGSAPVVLLAGGIGITPLISMATALQAAGRDFVLHYSGRTRAGMGFVDDLTASFGDKVHLYTDDETPMSLPQVLADAAGSHLYICGPKGMIDAARSAAVTAGLDEANIHVELFATPETQAGDTAFEVEIHDSGQVFQIPADKSIIQTLEEAGMDLMYDCQRGDCGICQTDVISGIPDHRDVILTESERASGKIMQICVSRAKSARLVLDL